ncbi:MAG: hypothetical protein JSV11_03340, partial [Nitrospiraceae bacterium]
MSKISMKPILVPFHILASKAFLLWVIFAWILFYSASSIWVDEAFGKFIFLLRENIFVQAPFVLFLLSATLNLIRVSKEKFQRSKVGYLFWLILPLGAILFFSGFFVSVVYRQQGQRIVGVDDIISPPWGGEQYRIISIDPGLPDRLAGMGASAGIFAYEPKMMLRDRFSQISEIGAFPPKNINNTYYHILNLGIAPGVRLHEGTKLITEGYMILRILAPGSIDHFEIPPYPYKFSVSLEPEIREQQAHGRGMEINLIQPHYSVKVFKGEKAVAEGSSLKDIHFDNLTLSFYKPIYWALVEAVKDPALPVMHAGLVLIIIGMPVYLIRFIFGLIKR